MYWKNIFLVKALKANPNFKSREKISAIKYIRKFYNGQQKVLYFYNDYTRIVSYTK